MYIGIGYMAVVSLVAFIVLDISTFSIIPTGIFVIVVFVILALFFLLVFIDIGIIPAVIANNFEPFLNEL